MTFSSGMKMSSLPVTRRLRGRLFAVPTWIVGLLACFLVAAQRAISHASSRADAVPSKGEQLRALQTIATLVSNLATLEVPREEESRNEDEDVRQVDAYALAREREDDDLPLTPSMGEADRSIASTTQTNLQQHGQVESSARTRSAISASSTAASSSLSTLSSLISSTLNRNATVILNPTSADNAALATALKVTTLDAFLSQLNVYPRLSQIPSFEAALVAKAKDLATTDPDAAAASLIKLLVNKGWDFSRLLQFTSQAGDVISQLSGMPTTGNVTLKTSPSGLNRYYTSRLNEELLKLKKMIQEAQNNSTAAGQIVNLPGHATGTSLLLPKGIRFESGIMNLSHYVHDLQAEAAFGAYFSTQWQHLLSSARTQSDIAKYYESGMTLSHLLEEYPLWNSSLAYYSAGGAGIAPNTDARRGFTEYMKRAQENEGQSAASSGQGEDDDSLPRRQGIFGEVDLSPNGIWDLLKAFLMREERRSRNSDYTAMRLLTGTSSFEAEGTPAEQRASMCEADLQRWIAAMSYAVKIKEGEMGKNDAATNVTTQNEIDLYRSKAKDITARCSCSNDNAFAVPLAAKCPAECAFTQRLGDSFCYKVCVRPSQCGDFHSLRHYAHPESRECSIPCGSRGDDLIPGCVECDATNSGGRCHRCENGLELTGSGAVCVNRMLLQLEDIQYGAIVLSLLFLVGYMLQLCCRPTVNARTSNFAREFRRCCKPHKVFFSKKLDKFAFFPARVMLLPGPTEVGPAHYYLFAFHRLVIFVSAALAAQLWITRYMVSGQNLFTSQALSDFASFQAAGTHPKYTNGTAVDVNRMCAAVYEKDGIGITPKNGTNATSNGTSTIRSFMEVREYHHHRRKFEDGERGKIHSRSNMLASSFLDEESEASETIDTTLSRRKNARGKRPKRSSSSAETRSRMQEQDHAAWPTRIFTGVADQVLRSLGGIEEKTIAFIKSQMLETKGRRHAIEIGSGMEMGPLILMEDDEVQEKESESSPGAERERAEDADHKNAVRKHEESPENDSINTVDKELQDVAVVSSSRSRKPKRGKSSATEPSLLEQSAKATSLRSPRPRDDNFDEDDAGDEDEDSMFAGDRDDALFLEAEDDAVDEEESSRRSRKSSPRPKSMINGDLNSGDGDHDSDTDSTPSSSSSYLFLMSFFSSSSTLLNLQASATASRHGQGGNNKATTSFRKGTTWLQVVDPSTSPEIEGAQKRLSAREEEALLSFLETGDGDAREQKRQAHEEAMAAGMLGVYVGAIMLTLSYYLSVVRISHFLDSILPSPRQFSLVGSGFPDGVDTEEIRMWLMEWIPGIRLVGVSLRYLPAINFDKHIERAVLQMLKEHCNKKAKRVFDIRAQGPPLSDDEGGHGGDDSSNEDDDDDQSPVTPTAPPVTAAAKAELRALTKAERKEKRAAIEVQKRLLMDAPRTKEALRLRHETEAAKLEDSHGDGNTPFAGPVGEKYPHGFQEMRAKMRVEKRLKKQKKAAEGGLRRGNVLEDDEIDKDDPDANGHESDSSGEEDVSQAHSSPTGSPTARPGAAGGQGQRKKKAEIGCCGRCHRRLIRPTPQTDALFGFGPVSTALVPFVDRLSAKDEQFLFAQLLKCRTDGTVYITFATREMRELVLSKLDADFLPFRGKHYVSLSPVDADPENVNWRLEFRAQRLVVAVGSMIVLLFVYVLLSIPNAYLNIVYARTPGQELHFITDWLTGLGSAIGAMHIVRVGGAVFTWVGFTNRETRNVFFFVATYFSVIGMLIIDIGIIWLITLGKVFDAVNENSKFDLHSLLAVEAQDFLLPFVFSVLFFDLILDVLLPAYVGRNVVRSRMYERISAEKLVSPNAFDYPAQYVTILLTFFAFVVWCWLDVEAVAYLLVGLVVVLCIMYLLTVYSSVRLYKRTSITSPSACRTAFRLWGVGLGQILWNAATYAERRGYVDLNDSGIALIAAHFGLYFLALYMIDSWNEPRAGGTEGEPVSYEEMMLRRAHTGDSATYFNCNHIACLRSKYLRDNPLLADPNGLFKIHDLQHRKDLTQDEKKEEAQRHLDYLWFGRREAGCPGVITPYVAGYDHLQPGMPRLYSSTPIERGDMLERETFAEDEKFLRDEELILEAAVPQSVVDAVTAARRAP